MELAKLIGMRPGNLLSKTPRNAPFNMEKEVLYANPHKFEPNSAQRDSYVEHRVTKYSLIFLSLKSSGRHVKPLVSPEELVTIPDVRATFHSTQHILRQLLGS